MSAKMSAIHHDRARVARLSQSYPADHQKLRDARRDLAASRLASYIAKTVEAAPDLTHEQRDRLALLLRSPAGEGAA